MKTQPCMPCYTCQSHRVHTDVLCVYYVVYIQRRITSTESRVGSNSNTGHSQSNSRGHAQANGNSNGAAPSGIFTRIREIQAADGRVRHWCHLSVFCVSHIYSNMGLYVQGLAFVDAVRVRLDPPSSSLSTSSHPPSLSVPPARSPWRARARS